MTNVETKIEAQDELQLWESLHELLKSNVVEVVFEKKDGTVREMACTLDKSLIDYEFKTDGGAEQVDQTPISERTHVTVWDVENNGWRRITRGSIIQLNVLDCVEDEEE